MPNADLLLGYPTFVISILGIGMVTAVIGDMASHVGCTIGLKDTITAIGFVALGTSVPGNLVEKKKEKGKSSFQVTVGNWWFSQVTAFLEILLFLSFF